MRCFTGSVIVVVVLALLMASCGGDDAASTTAATTATSTTTTTTTTTTAPTTTTTTTTTAPTTTEAPTTTAPVRFGEDDLAAAILQDGDPWVLPTNGLTPNPWGIDDIWHQDQWPEEWAAYQEAGFITGLWSGVGGNSEAENATCFTSNHTAAHLFASADGAAAAVDLFRSSLDDPEWVTRLGGAPEGSWLTVQPIEGLDLGDQAVGIHATGERSQVVIVAWATDNLLQYVFAFCGDVAVEGFPTVALDLVHLLADRTG